MLCIYVDLDILCSPQLASRGEPLFVRVSIFWRDPEPGFFWSGTRILGINYRWLDYQVIHRYININIVGESGFRLYIDIINSVVSALCNSLVSSKVLKIKVLALKSLCVPALESEQFCRCDWRSHPRATQILLNATRKVVLYLMH